MTLAPSPAMCQSSAIQVHFLILLSLESRQVQTSVPSTFLAVDFRGKRLFVCMILPLHSPGIVVGDLNSQSFTWLPTKFLFELSLIPCKLLYHQWPWQLDVCHPHISFAHQ